MEAHLGIQLFKRTTHGVVLTDAGHSIYEDAKNIIHLSHLAVERAKAIAQRDDSIIRVGTSLMTKCRYLMDIWSRASAVGLDAKIELVPQKGIQFMTQNPLKDLGKDYDLQEGIYFSGLYGEQCGFLELFPARFCLAVPSSHGLSNRERLLLEDLRNQQVIVPKHGDSIHFDQMRDALLSLDLGIELIEVEYYDVNIFATCELNNYLLLLIDVWSDIYPSMKICKINSDLSVPYGLVYPTTPTQQVQKLLEIADGLVKDGHFKNPK